MHHIISCFRKGSVCVLASRKCFFASFHSKVSKVWQQKTNSERSKGTLVTTLYQFLNYVYCLYCLNSKCEFFRGKLPSIFQPWRLSGMLTNTMAGQNTDSCLRPRQQQSRYFWKPLLKKKKNRKSPWFDLFIHWLIKQMTNTCRNHFSRSYENHSNARFRQCTFISWIEFHKLSS